MTKNFLNFIIVFASVLLISGCGTYTPLPTHGGGKRFATEQVLVSSVSKKAISDIPFEKLKGKRIVLETSVIHDEGGGYLNGGRSFSTESYSLLNQKPNASAMPGDPVTSSKGWSVGVGSMRSDNNYTKDLTFASTDSKHLINSIISAAIRNNILVNPSPEDGAPDYLVEVLVDALGTVRSRTDWAFKNSEQLKAQISFEYVITPLSAAVEQKRTQGTVAYEATYRESYVLWMGPTSTNYSIEKLDLSQLISDLGRGVDQFDNIKRDQSKEMIPTNTGSNVPIQINPRIK